MFSDFFTSHAAGFGGAARALVWEHMIHQAIILLRRAENRIRSADRQQQLMQLDGWWRDKRAKLNGSLVRIPAEEALSEALYEEMTRVKEDIILNSVPTDANLSDLDTLQVALEVPRRRKGGIGKRSKPTDIQFYRTGSAILDLRIEAKIVLRDKDIQTSYLSRSGLKRFSDPKEPYTDQEIGGMLAYTISDERGNWLTKIDRALTEAAPPITTFKHRVHASNDETLFCRVPYAAEITARNEVLVFHMVLEFESDPSARA